MASGGNAPLKLKMDLRSTYLFAQMYIGDMAEEDEERFRWVYDLYRDVAEAMKAAFESGKSRRTIESVRFQLGIFSDLEPWLEREVLAKRFKGSMARGAWSRILEQRVPRWHVG